MFKKTISFIGSILILLIISGYQASADAKLTEVIDLTGEYDSIATVDTKPLTAKGSIRVDGTEAVTPWDVKVKVGQLKNTLTNAPLGINYFKYQFNSGQMTNYLDNITEYRGDDVLSTSDSCLEQSQTLLRGSGSAAVNYSAVEAGFTVANQTAISEGVYYSKITYTFTTGMNSTHSVVFDSQGGSSVATAQANHDGLVAKPADPTKDGYKFLGWSRTKNSSTYFDFNNDKISVKTTLYAQWTRLTITFKNYDGSAEIQPQGETSTSKQVPYNQPYSVPVAPAVTNQLFLGWSAVPNMTRGTTPTLYVPTGIDYTTTYKNSLNSLDQAYLGGGGDGASFTATQDTTLYAVYIKTLPATTTPNVDAPILEEFIWNKAVWRVIKADGEKRLVVKVNCLTNEEVDSTGESEALVSFATGRTTYFKSNDTSTGYGESILKEKIDTWFTSKFSAETLKNILPVDLDLPTLQDLQVKGQFLKDGETITFDKTNEETYSWPEIYNLTDFKTSLADIITNDSTKYQINDTSVNAYQKQAFALSLGDLNSLAGVNTTTHQTNLLSYFNAGRYWNRSVGRTLITANVGIYEPPSYDGFGYRGYLSSGTTSRIRPALWLSLEAQHLVTFDSQGGSVVAGKSIKAGTTLGELPTPTKSNHNFKGWFTDKDCSSGNEVTSASVVNADMKLYAKWQVHLQPGEYIKIADQAWRVLHVDATQNQVLVIRENALTKDELATALAPSDVSAGAQVKFHTTGTNYYPSESSTGYGDSKLKAAIDSYYSSAIANHADASKVLAVDLQLANYAALKSGLTASTSPEYSDRYDRFGLNGTSSDTRFATIVSDTGAKQAFALSYGDLNTTLSPLDNTRLTFGTSSLDLTKRYWLRSAGFRYNYGASFSSSKQSDTSLNDSYAVRPSLYLDLTQITEKVNPIYYVTGKGGNYGDNPTWYATDASEITLKMPTATGYGFGGWYQEEGLTNPITNIDTSGTAKQTVYGKWTGHTYTINYLDNITESPNIVATRTKVYGTGASGQGDTQYFHPADKIIREGFEHTYWNTQADGQGYSFASGQQYAGIINTEIYHSPSSNNGTKNLYAIWEARSDVTVSFDTNGGGIISPINAKYNAMITPPANPTKDGYTFDSWHTSSALNNKVDLTTRRFTSNVTLYAKWTAKTYQIKYDKNGGEGSASSSQITKTYGTTNTHSFEGTLYKEGYSFNGWSTSQAYTESPIVAGSEISDSALYTGSDVTLYANWKPEADVKVNFVNYSGISNNTYASTTVKYNAKATSPGTPTALAGKTFTNFSGWYTAEGPIGGNQIGSGRLTTETTYFARWYGTVTIDWQNDVNTTGNTWTQWYLEDTTGANFAKQPVFTGYDYAGVYTEIAGGGTQVGSADISRPYVSGTSVIDSNHRWIATDVSTVYAKWTQSVTLDNQGTTNSSFTATYNGVQANISPPTYGDKVFAGYYTEANGGGSQIFTSTGAVNKNVTDYTDSTGKWIKKGATTLYAKWESIYTVTILKDSAAYGSKTLTLKQGGTTKATATSDSSGLAKFSGITNGNYDLYDGDTKLESSIAVSVGGSRTINYWTVSFNSGSGGSAVADQIVYNGKSVTKPSADPTRTGYRFVSWMTESDGTTEYFVAESPKTVTAKTTIYAKWVQVFTISFKTMDGTADLTPKTWSSSSKLVDIGASLDLPDAPVSETGYFLGWAESSNAWKSSNLWLPVASTGYVNIRDSLNVPDVTFLRYNSQGNTLTNITANKTLYAVYYKKLKGTGAADLDAPYKQEFIWNNALWRVIKADGNRRLILKVSALTNAETYSWDSGADNPDLPDKTVFNSGGNYFDNSGNSRYLGSDVKTKIERYYNRLSDKTAIQSVSLNLPTLSTFTNNYFDTGNYVGTSDSTETNWEWNNWYTDSRFATLLDVNGTSQAFALSYGDIQSLASNDDQKKNLLNFANSNLNLYWLRSPGEIYHKTGIVNTGNYQDSYTQNAGSIPANRPGIRPALWVKIN